jgi:hypothetical protein
MLIFGVIFWFAILGTLIASVIYQHWIVTAAMVLNLLSLTIQLMQVWERR